MKKTYYLLKHKNNPNQLPYEWDGLDSIEKAMEARDIAINAYGIDCTIIKRTEEVVE